ncbi:proline--tRNA ligase [Mycoplasma marinum]|uniref:Proline--tRNA ligase n=1 Tax=Mycoplasma marinum TaxID=1937190 RepID=A0A4R0XPQ2_9MOLU|nr:proline--tRNA ligase [Mycoplasma marinum]TCG11522.1 proline--tRNA ligase [Mycoplasma marinum]
MKKLDKITPQEQEFSRWYTDVVKQGQLMEYGPVKGTIIFKPNAYGIWENIQTEFNKIIKSKGVQNVYLPVLIPLSYIEKEKDHVKGFAPELATITKVGEKELNEYAVMRPTSEVLFGELFSKEINSYNDLPIMYNQWANVLRWEKTTNPFLRTSEFLWQEGHTAHSNALEARKLSRTMIKEYAKFLEKFLAIPTIVGKKTPKEKFAGAVTTYTIEAMMKDGKALQSGTSHYLGQNFAKAFNVSFQNKDNKQELAYQTSWGVSTRLIGAIIMTHGDDRGIIMPPKIAPTQIDVLEIFGNKHENVHATAQDLIKQLGRKWRVRLDASDKGPGFKAGQSEIQGTPLRIEVGPRDLEQGLVTLVRRDTLEKIQVPVNDVKNRIKKLLEDIHNNLLSSAKQRLEEKTVYTESYEEFKEIFKDDKNLKFVIVPFAGDEEDENKIKKETFASTRCLPFKFDKPGIRRCIITGKETKRFVIFAKAY